MAEKSDMVKLVTEKSGRQLQAQQDATRSGIDLVPTVIREAGPKAVESYRPSQSVAWELNRFP
jgi:hypothetical protein